MSTVDYYGSARNVILQYWRMGGYLCPHPSCTYEIPHSFGFEVIAVAVFLQIEADNAFVFDRASVRVLDFF